MASATSSAIPLRSLVRWPSIAQIAARDLTVLGLWKTDDDADNTDSAVIVHVSPTDTERVPLLLSEDGRSCDKAPAAHMPRTCLTSVTVGAQFPI